MTSKNGILRKTALLMSLVLAACSHQQTREIANAQGHVNLVRLTDHIYVAEDSFYYPENSAVYIGDKYVTVISATWTPETAKLLVQKIRLVTSKPIKTVIDTHFHLDRTGGNPYFKEIGAQIVGSKMTVELMKKTWEDRVKSARKDYVGFPAIPLVLPDITFTDKYDLEGGKIQIRYFGPSHTEDDSVVYFPEEEVLFGDCVLKERLGYLGDANLAEYPKTLERIKKLKIKTIIAGHWTAIHGPELIDQDLELLRKQALSGPTK